MDESIHGEIKAYIEVHHPALNPPIDRWRPRGTTRVRCTSWDLGKKASLHRGIVKAEPASPRSRRRTDRAFSTCHPPHSLEAEQGVIGGLLLDNNTWDLIADQLVERILPPRTSAYFPDHNCACREAIPFDIVTVHDALPRPCSLGGPGILG